MDAAYHWIVLRDDETTDWCLYCYLLDVHGMEGGRRAKNSQGIYACYGCISALLLFVWVLAEAPIKYVEQSLELRIISISRSCRYLSTL